MPFIHNDEESTTDADWIIPARFQDDCQECAVEAWERMTYGGVGFHPKRWIVTERVIDSIGACDIQRSMRTVYVTR